jgi:hypothetical protein
LKLALRGLFRGWQISADAAADFNIAQPMLA